MIDPDSHLNHKHKKMNREEKRAFMKELIPLMSSLVQPLIKLSKITSVSSTKVRIVNS